MHGKSDGLTAELEDFEDWTKRQLPAELLPVPKDCCAYSLYVVFKTKGIKAAKDWMKKNGTC